MSKNKTITHISHNDYLKLRGLVALAEQANKTLDQLVLCARELTGDEEYGLITECIYGSTSLAEALSNLNITVDAEP